MPSKQELEVRVAALEAELAAARAKLSSALSAPSAPTETDPASWFALIWRSWKTLEALWKNGGSWTKLLIASAVILTLAVLALVYLPVREILPRANSPDSLPLGVPPKELGIVAMWTGSFADVENQRLSAQIRQARTIKFMAYNADQFIQNFSPEFEEFFNHRDTSMQVLLADPTDPFYIDTTKFILRRELSNEEIASYQKHLDDVVSRLKTLERVRGQQVEIRLFKNQLRAPIIIIDDKVCILTVRLPPFESKQSLRIEFDTAPLGFNTKCITHFNQLWGISHGSSRTFSKP